MPSDLHLIAGRVVRPLIAITVTAFLLITPARVGAQEMPAGSSANRDARIVVATGPHWRPGYMVSTTTRYACGERRISLQSTIEPGSPAPRWRMVVQRLTIDGRRASRAMVDAFNLFLIDFPSPPDVNVECIGPRLRFNMTLYEGGATHRRATYEVETR